MVWKVLVVYIFFAANNGNDRLVVYKYYNIETIKQRIVFVKCAFITLIFYSSDFDYCFFLWYIITNYNELF